MEERDIVDIATESLVIGNLVNNPSLFTEYEELISVQYDFTDDGLKFLYRLLFETWLDNNKIDETLLSIKVSQKDQEDKDQYSQLGGFKAYQRLASVASSKNDFKKLYERLKTFNLLRELNRKGFNVEKYFDKLKDKSPDQIMKAYESQLMKVGSYIKGIEDSVNLGSNMTAFYNSLKEKPDIGITIPHPIINSLVRGWRTCKVYASGMGSGMGKSREMCLYATHIGIINQTPLLIIVNEQDEVEWKLMLLTCVINNIFAPKTGVYINEDEIALGQLTGEKDQIAQEASKYIEEHSKIMFQEIDIYNFENLRLIFKKHKLRGINHVIYDTFKPFRGGEKGMEDWQRFVATSEKIKKVVGSKAKNGLEMGCILTFQLTDDAIANKILNSTAIASGKNIKHVLDMVKMSRALDARDKQKIKVKIHMPGNPFNGQVQTLEPHKDYYMTFLDKNRGGRDKVYIIYEVDKGKILFKELGTAVFED